MGSNRAAKRAARACATTAVAVAALVGCGGGDEAAAPEEPRLPPAVAERLAQRSEDVAAALADGDTCLARDRAAALRDEARRAIEAQEVPSELRGELERTASELAAEIECAPPPPPVDDQAEDDEEGEEKEKPKKEKDDKGKGKDKDGDDVLDDALEDVPAPTDDGLTSTQEEPTAKTGSCE